MLLAAVGLKLVPEMVTEVPEGPEIGVNEEMVGTWATAEIAIPSRSQKARRFFLNT